MVLKKKTATRKRHLKLNKNLIAYVPPQYKKLPSTTYVEYYATTPDGELKRKRTYLNKYPAGMRRKIAMQMIKELNSRLENGWSPFLEQEPESFLTVAITAIQEYVKEKSKETRAHSTRSIVSKMNSLTDIIKLEKEFMTCLEIDQQFAKRIMKYIYTTRDISPVTYNNYLAHFKMFGAWCVQSGYMKANPFTGITKKKVQEKSRQPFPDKVLDRVMKYTQKNEPGMYIICQLVYYGMRPNEISQIKIRDIDLEKKIINVDVEVSKTAKHRTITIPNALLPHIQKHIKKAKKNAYLISDNYRAGSKKRSSKFIGDAWLKIRHELELKLEYKMYSLRDTGIVNMLNKGISPKYIMDQYGHTSLDITSIYAKYMSHNANTDILEL